MKVEKALEQVMNTLKEWPSVECVTVMEYQDDIYDPYFFLSLDVYLTQSLPDENQRKESFAYTGAFEPGTVGTKDRFILADMPFRLEYKRTDRFNDIATIISSSHGKLRDSGTYHIHRLLYSTVLFDRNGWIDSIRSQLLNFSDSFWQGIRVENQTKMEHYLNDLGAAVLRNDNLFFAVSSAGFIKSLCSTLYALNKTLEPSTRYLSTAIYTLPILPEAFPGTLESFLRPQEISLSRKREIAEILTKKVIHLN